MCVCVCEREREKECVGWYSIFSFPHIKGAINFSLLSLAECNTHTRAAGRLGPDLANTQDELIYQVAHSRTRASPTRLSGEWEIKLETERVETRRAFIRRKRCTGEREKEVRGRLKPKYTRRRRDLQFKSLPVSTRAPRSIRQSQRNPRQLQALWGPWHNRCRNNFLQVRANKKERRKLPVFSPTACLFPAGFKNSIISCFHSPYLHLCIEINKSQFKYAIWRLSSLEDLRL